MSITPMWEQLILNLAGLVYERTLDYMPREDAYMELKYLTGQDFGYDIRSWEDWIVENEYPDLRKIESPS